MKSISFLFLLFLFLPLQTLGENYYKWVDEQGNVHFTDNYVTIPVSCRGRVSAEHYHDVPQGRLSSHTPKQVVIHFEREGDAIFVQGVLNWKRSVLFHLDTGASITLITREDALALGIDPDRSPTTMGYVADGSVVEFPTATLASLRVGEAEVDEVEVAIGNVRLLGMNFLNKFHLTIDSENGQLLLERNDAVRVEESPAVREKKAYTVAELESTIAQIGIAIRARERTRFESSDISRDRSTEKKIARYESLLNSIIRRISLQRDAMQMHREEIEQLKVKCGRCTQLVEQLR